MKKNGFTMVELIAIIVIMASMLLIILPAINNTIKNSEEKEKQESLNNIYMAAENYLMANYDDYTINNTGDVTYVYIIDLISNNYMSIDTLNPNNDSTFSNKDAVKVTRNADGTFSYELVYLKTLIETLLEQYSPDNTNGLLRDSVNENLYYYKGTRGQVANNYVWYGGHQWQIIEFNTEENTIRLRTSQPITNISLSKRVWKNSEEYNNSYLMIWLKEEFYDVLPGEIKTNLVSSTYNVGVETDVDSITAINKYGLLDVEEYKRAGEANSFLDNKDNIIFPNNIDKDYWRSSNNAGLLDGKFALFNDAEILPVITIRDINITKGTGTLSDNFILESLKSHSTEDALIGEYISVPTTGNYCGSDNMCLFRIVKHGENGLKVILNGTLPELKNYLPSPTITKEHEIYKYLGQFVDSISSNYKSVADEKIYMSITATSEKMWDDIGNMGYDYKNLRKEYLLSSYGLPSLGEIFTTNDIDLFNSSVPETIGCFVDKSVVENYVTDIDNDIYLNGNFSNYYLMNKDGYYNNPRYMNANGFTSGNSMEYDYLVRPVMHLKYNLTFTGGDGTAQNPYTLN